MVPVPFVDAELPVGVVPDQYHEHQRERQSHHIDHRIERIVLQKSQEIFHCLNSFVNLKTDEKIRSSAQGLFMLMTNGIGATIGTLGAQAIVNHFVYNSANPSWSSAWYIFAGYALVVAVLFMFLFKDPGKEKTA